LYEDNRGKDGQTDRLKTPMQSLLHQRGNDLMQLSGHGLTEGKKARPGMAGPGQAHPVLQ